MSKTHIITLVALIAMTSVAVSQWLQNRGLRETNTALLKQVGVLQLPQALAPPPGGAKRGGPENAPGGGTVAGAPGGPGRPDDKNDPGRAEREARFREMRSMERSQRLDSRMLALRTKLNLTPEQEAAVRAAMEKGSKDREALRDGMWNRPPTENAEAEEARRKEDAAKFAASDAAQEEGVTAAMTPDQLTAYSEYKEEQRRTEMDNRANQQLSDLQGRLSLTDEQKDAAFEYFAGQAQTFDPREIMARGGDVRAAFEEQQKVQLEAMSQILTPEQYELYSKQEEQRAAMFRNGGGGFGPPGRPPGGP